MKPTLAVAALALALSACATAREPVAATPETLAKASEDCSRETTALGSVSPGAPQPAFKDPEFAPPDQWPRAIRTAQPGVRGSTDRYDADYARCVGVREYRAPR